MNESYSLIGVDSHALSVISYVAKAMKKEKYTEKQISDYRENAMLGSYENLLSVSQNVVNELNDSGDVK